MGYGILIWVAAIVLQAQEPAAKAAVNAAADEKTSTQMKEGRRLLENGRYAEAEEKLNAIGDEARKSSTLLSPQLRAKLAVDLAESQAGQGEYDKAIAGLEAAEAAVKDNADLPAKLADLHVLRGRWEAADGAIARRSSSMPATFRPVGVKRDCSSCGVRLRSQWPRGSGLSIATTRNGLRSSLRPMRLCWWARRPSADYRASARGQELADGLNDVINDIYEAALRVDPNCWRAPLLEGRLFLSGYKERLAFKELSRAQQINPLAPEVLVTLGGADLQGYRLAAGRAKAERALATNPHYGPAYVLMADVNISDERFVDAKEAALKAVAENPRDEDALARLAASCRLLVDPVGAAAAELKALAINPRPATFYAALGERLADRRKYHSAERAFLLAAAADPNRAEAPIGLGMLYMQVGRETEAKSLFDTAFASDPFNVRADNMMRVLSHMASYTSIDSSHFSVVVDPTQDELLGRYMSKYLESVYPELATRFGYSPPGRTKIEILKTHEWFSGRTVGLPFVPTVGACTGRVVALASPPRDADTL